MKVIFFIFLALISSLSAFTDEEYNKKALEGYDAVVVYTFGKVGHSSLRDFFRQYRPTKPTHEPEPITDYLQENKKILIVNAMRNAFDRNVSCLFQHINAGIVPLPDNYKLADLLRVFPEFNRSEMDKLKFWYADFNRLLGLHIFDQPFDFEKKYYFERGENFDLLVLRFEDIAEWALILEKALSLRSVQIPKKNVRSHPLYEPFKKKHKYSAEEANLILSLDYMNHFYNEKELAKFVKKHT